MEEHPGPVELCRAELAAGGLIRCADFGAHFCRLKAHSPRIDHRCSCGVVFRLRSDDWAQTIFDQRDAALEAVARVQKLHTCSRPHPRYVDHCTHCLGPWPCETVQALEGGSA